MSRFSRLSLIFGVLALLVLLAGSMLLPNRHNTLSASTVPSKAQTPAKPVPPPTPNVTTAPPGTILYTASKGDTMPGLLHKYLWQSTYMTAPEFEAAIRSQNGDFKGVFLKPGQNYIIP